jgi:hypothetical protein
MVRKYEIDQGVENQRLFKAIKRTTKCYIRSE